MIESWFFVLAMLAVLLIPGPTNALLATAAHSQGLSKAFWLIPMEWLGYAYGISFWAVFIHLAAPVWPAAVHQRKPAPAAQIHPNNLAATALALEASGRTHKALQS